MRDVWVEFVDENETHITTLNTALLDLETDPDDRDAIDRLFRTAHTLKGNCGTMGLDEPGRLAHALEDLLAAVRAGSVTVSTAVMDDLFEAVDVLEEMLQEIEQDGTVTTDPASTIDQLRVRVADGDAEDSASESTGPPTDAEIEQTLGRLDPPTDPGHDTYYVRLWIDETNRHERVTNGTLVVEALVDAFDLRGTDPPRAAIDDDEYDGRIDAVFGTPVGQSAIEAALEPVAAVETFEIVRVSESLWDRSSGVESGPDLETTAADLTSDEAQDLDVDTLLEEFDEFDDLDALVEEFEEDELEPFEEMGEAGSFDDLLGADERSETPSDEAAADSPSNEAPGDSTAVDAADDVEDASAVFQELKAEVEMVDFDELQAELDELEFDEYEDEVEMEELIGDDVDLTDTGFLQDEAASTSVGYDDPEPSEGTDESPAGASVPSETAADSPAGPADDGDGVTSEAMGGGAEPVDVDTPDSSPPEDVTEPTTPGVEASGEPSHDDEQPSVDDERAGMDDEQASVDDEQVAADPSTAGDAVEATDRASTAFDDELGDDTATGESSSADAFEFGPPVVDDPKQASSSTGADDESNTADGLEDLFDPATEADVDTTVPGATGDTDPLPADRSADTGGFGGATSAAGDVRTPDGERVTADEAEPSGVDSMPDDESVAERTTSITDEFELEGSPASNDFDGPTVQHDAGFEAATDDGFDEAAIDDEFDDVPDDGFDDVPDDGFADAASNGFEESNEDGFPDANSAGFGEVPVDGVADTASDGFDEVDSGEFDEPTHVDFDPAQAAFSDDRATVDDDGFGTAVDEDEGIETAVDETTFDDGADTTAADVEDDPNAIDPPEFDAADDSFEDTFGADVFDTDDAAFADTAVDQRDTNTATESGTVETEFDEDGSFDSDSPAEADVERVVEQPEIPNPGITLPAESTAEEDAEPAGSRGTVRVDVDQLESLATLVEGLVTTRVRLRDAVESGADPAVIDRELTDLDELTGDLQETVMDLRLVPIEGVTTRLPRVVRDIAREQDKEVQFELTGGDVELDRSVLDRIREPLVHLVRNAVDHGIEPPAARSEAEKPPEGTVAVRAERTRDRVTITVEDDGRGIDTESLVDRAVDADVLEASEAEDLSEEAAVELLFHPGLSTATEVTDVSGRGVGMDVVKRTVESLDGSVSIETTPAAGTTVTMTLPVTVAIADVLFVESGSAEFGVPLKVVRDVDTADRVERLEDGRLVIDVGEDPQPVLSLGETLETGDGAEEDALIRVREGVRSVAIRCDRVTDQKEVVVTPFDGFLSDIPGVSGATVRGRGNVVPILDVTTL